MNDALVRIVVPAYNEAVTIEEVLRRVSRVPFRREVIVVDDGSTDGMADLEYDPKDLPKLRANGRRRQEQHVARQDTGGRCSRALPDQRLRSSRSARVMSRMSSSKLVWGLQPRTRSAFP
jgi:Glycosyl transferase family 2